MTGFIHRQSIQHFALGAIGATMPVSSIVADVPAKQPNIIIFLVDDLGWNHISADKATMGTHKRFYHTPNIEKLAKNGVSFTHAYQQPNCAPSRAAMLTGQYPARIHNNVYSVRNLNRRNSTEGLRFVGPPQSEDVGAEAVTIAEALKRNGYATAHIGKYHVGGHDGEQTLPENAGFDINIGGYSQGHQPTCFASQADGKWDFQGVGRGDFANYAAPYSKAYVEKHKMPKRLVGQPKHISDALGDALEDTIAKLRSGDRPFYLQFHTYAVHSPVRSRPDLKLEATSRMEGLPEELQEYAGFVAGVDWNLGRMLAALDDPNGDGDTSDSILDNTIILFTSDNGGTFADNLPLKGKKGMFTEGGIRVPLIAYWPGVLPPDTVTDYQVHSVDFYPTCLELAGNKWLPPETEHPMDGYSFADVLRNPSAKHEREPIFYLFPGYMDRRAQPCVVAIGDVGAKRYKLFYYYESELPRNLENTRPASSSWELYCLTDDQEESENLMESHPEVAAELSKKIHDWLNKEHPTWKPKYPIDKVSGNPVPPPVFTTLGK